MNRFVAHALCLAFALLVLGTICTTAIAQQNPASTIKPLVVFLLDTSGSMEYEAGNALNTTEEFSVPQCEEPGASGPTKFAAGNYPKSRLLVQIRLPRR